MKNIEQPESVELNNQNFTESEERTAGEPNSNKTEEIQNSAEGSINLGKFKDAESLLKAYNSLQTEFTKKSQKLSELENSNTEFNKDEKLNQAIKELEQDYGIAQRFSQNIKQALKNVDADNYSNLAKEELIKNLQSSYKSAEEFACDEQFLQQFIYNNEKIKENIIKSYLANIKSNTPIKLVSNVSSSIPLSPPANPTTIKDAGRLAQKIIKQI